MQFLAGLENTLKLDAQAQKTSQQRVHDKSAADVERVLAQLHIVDTHICQSRTLLLLHIQQTHGYRSRLPDWVLTC